MLALGLMALAGRGLAIIPMPKMPAFTGNSKSIFLLGIFSGAATSCCAPVLVGAITLAVLTASFWKALAVTFAYVFGMTLPLFIAAYFYDRFNISQSKFISGKMFKIEIAKKKIYIHSTNLIAGIIFLVMGFMLLALAFSGNAFWAPTYQAEIGKILNQWSQKLLNILSGVPDIIWGVLIIGFFLFLLYRAKNKSDKE